MLTHSNRTVDKEMYTVYISNTFRDILDIDDEDESDSSKMRVIMSRVEVLI
jgi:hypothetical protein